MNDSSHTEQQPAHWVAAVSDRGLRHDSNDDAFAVHASQEAARYAVLVVCDGVSSARDPHLAAQTASVLIAESLAHPNPDLPQPQVLTEALARANDAVSALATDPDYPPSCTAAVAVITAASLDVSWAGDSRVYWLPDAAQAELLTTDDSMAQLRIEWGVDRDQAEHGPGAHTITRWLGSGAPNDPAHTISRVIDAPGWVLVCSDGLWNYASSPAELAVVVSGIPAADPDRPDPLALARALVDWANAHGGGDNITVALARVE